jgi:hypothetical protein
VLFLAGNITQDAAGNGAYAEGYDVVTAIPVPATNNASHRHRCKDLRYEYL